MSNRTDLDLWRQLTVPVIALDEMQGYIMMTSTHTSSSFILKKARVPDQKVGKANLFHTLILENPTFPHEIVFLILTQKAIVHTVL